MRVLDATVLTGEDKLDEEIEGACGCDLISDLLAFTKARMLVLTGLVTSQIIRAAEMMDLSGIVFVRGKRPTAEIVAMAAEAGIPILCTSYPLYESAGLLFEAGLRGKCAWPRAEDHGTPGVGAESSGEGVADSHDGQDSRASAPAAGGGAGASATARAGCEDARTRVAGGG
jgi:hypothetical protein